MRALPDRLTIVPFDRPVDAVVRPPGSKSITNRALLCAALAAGTSRLDGVLFADDTEAMLSCIAGLGADVVIDRAAASVAVTGVAGTPNVAGATLDANQSGTTARFIAAAMALSSERGVLDADAAMRRRPLGATIDALRTLGASVEELGEAGHLPIAVKGPLTGVDRLEIPTSTSSQFTSGILMIGPLLPGGLTVTLIGDLVSRPYVDMTIAVMRSFGAVVDTPDDRTIVVSEGGYRATEYAVEPDASAASYFFALAAMTGGRIVVDGLGSDSLQGDLRFVDHLAAMGATVECSEHSTTVVGGTLRGIDADFSQISDTAQTLAAVAALAEGVTTVRGIGFIRAKETDRIAAVVGELKRCGVEACETADGFEIAPAPVRPAKIETHDDHRMAMSFTLIGLCRPGIEILDPGCVAKTFPNFFDVIESIRPGAS